MCPLVLALLAAALAASQAQQAAGPAPAPLLGCAWAQLYEAARLAGVDEWSVDLQLPDSMLQAGSQAQLVERAARDLQVRTVQGWLHLASRPRRMPAAGSPAAPVATAEPCDTRPLSILASRRAQAWWRTPAR